MDAGVHWVEQVFPPDFGGAVNALAFVDDHRGIAVGAGPEGSTTVRPAAAVMTDDGGRTWHAGTFPPGIDRLLDVTIVP